jgi:DNA-binding NarL/FixJ family response regulator
MGKKALPNFIFYIDAIAAVQSSAIYIDEKVRHVVNRLKDIPANQSEFTLSDREMEVLKLLVEGHSNDAIAEALFLSKSTIKSHLRRIMTKFEVNVEYKLLWWHCDPNWYSDSLASVGITADWQHHS